MSAPPSWRVFGGLPRRAQGTVWPIAPRLGVTAAHVVTPGPDVVEIHAHEGEPYAARCRAIEHEYDIAVLDLPSELPSAACPCGMPRDGAQARVQGWPGFADDEPAVLKGQLSVTVDGSCAVRVDHEVLRDRSWAGMSGAPVWSEGSVVGVVTRVHPARGLVRLTGVEQFNEMLPPDLQPLAGVPGADPRRAQLASARDEILRGTSHRGLAFVAYAGFEPRRFGRALATALAERTEACEVVASGSLGGSEPSIAARLLRAVATTEVPARGSDTLRAQLCLEDRVQQAANGGRRLVLHLQGLSHISTEEAVQLGNLLAVVCQHEGFRILATGGRRIRELQATEFDQHSAFHEVAYPLLGGLRSHQCDRLVDGMGLPEGWVWAMTAGHPALSREVAELVHRGTPPSEVWSQLFVHSDYLGVSKQRVWAHESLREGCARLHAHHGTLSEHGYDRVLDELQFLGLVRRDAHAWSWAAPVLQEWAAWIGAT